MTLSRIYGKERKNAKMFPCDRLTAGGRNPAAIRAGVLGKPVRKHIDAFSTARKLAPRPVETRLDLRADLSLSPVARE